MIVLHLILIVILAPSPFSLQFNGNVSLKSRLRKTRDLDYAIFYYYAEEEPEDANASPPCEEGYYRQKQKAICKPICKKPCTNGICTEPGKCSCNKDYELDPADKYRCLPICGIGKQRSLLNKGECEPAMCSKECINSQCRGPEKCHCLRGYKRDPSDIYACILKCTEVSCKNGTCTEEGECTCNKGYAKDPQGYCNPWCNPTCMNSTCTEPNVCTCYPGYKTINEYQCECPQENYLIDGICKPHNICNITCKDGRCSIAEKCYYCPAERKAVCILIEKPEEREKCLSSTFCLANCKCFDEVCICENTSTAPMITTTTTTTTTTTSFGHHYSSPVPDVRTYSDFSDPTAMDMQNNFSSTTVVSVGATAVVVLGVGIAAGILIRKRRKKSGDQIVQNDVYRIQISPETNAIDIENEIYEETNEYEEIGDKK